MGIKLRNIKYSWGLKAAAVILIWLCFLTIVESSIFLTISNEIADTSSYFDTHSFRYEFGSLVYKAVKANVELKGGENIKAEDAEHFHNIKNEVLGSVNFIYCIRNTTTGESITNIDGQDAVALIEKQPANVYVSAGRSKYDLQVYGAEIEEILGNTGYEVFAAVRQPLKPGDRFYYDYKDYSRLKLASTYASPLMILAAILLVVAACYLAHTAGLRGKGEAVALLLIDRLYSDVHTLLVMAAAVFSVFVAGRAFDIEKDIFWVAFTIVLSLDAFIGISYVLSMIRQIKCGTLFKNTLIVALYTKIKKLALFCLRGRMFRPSLLLLLLTYGVINGVLFDLGVDLTVGYQKPVFTVLLVAFNIIAVYFSGKALYSLSHIMAAAKEISTGNIDYTMNSSEISAAFKGLAEDMENIQGGLKKAVAEAVKGERLRTELITNVSHDLKTPLTSIVNYVDLLKKEDLNNQKADEYLSILEEKSARLKQLIEDLIEASKASSGNLNVNAEKVDLHELVMQAFGEYEEKIKKAELDIRISAEEKNTYIYADGKHMWRIVENLLSNVIKYSMPHSRVYVNLTRGSEFGSLTIKNVSASPLDISPEQLTERFVRGDVSRTTEGSGLGLSIAQSLTKLQGGRFKIEIDGDLFKVNVEIPLCSD